MINLLKNLIFEITTILYANISFYIENMFLKNNFTQTKLSKNGYEKIKIKKPVNYKKLKIKKLYINKYFEKILLDNSTIEKIIQKLLIENNLAEKIFQITGFKYNVNFILAYNTYYIPKVDQNKIWHSNVWHRDRAFSKNTLKIIIPLKNINKHDGGIEIKTLNKENKIYKMVANINELILFKPNLCLHRAGNLKKKGYRSQLMFQLNPSLKWSFNRNLEFLQKKREPKFPFFSNIFSKKQNLKI